MPTLNASSPQALAEELGQLLSYEVVRHWPSLVSYSENDYLRLNQLEFVPTLRTESPGQLAVKVYMRGAGELVVTTPGGLGTPTKAAPEVEMVTDEVIDFNGQEVATTERPVWTQAGQSSPVLVTYQSEFFGARSGGPVIMREVSPGVFALGEPGFGTLTVTYPTRAQVVTLDYEPLPAVLSAAQRKTLARTVVQMSGVVPESALPMIYLRLDYTLPRAGRDELKFTAVAKDRLKLNAYSVLWRFGQSAKDPNSLPGTTVDDAAQPALVLQETGRTTVRRRITSTTNPGQYVDVDVVKTLDLKETSTGRLWQLKLNES
ncbi:MAG: hypothetical protein KIS62_12475 [Ramlibacter sp.]|nr:hypothetical protein [Ramlibacter sp.]